MPVTDADLRAAERITRLMFGWGVAAKDFASLPGECRDVIAAAIAQGRVVVEAERDGWLEFFKHVKDYALKCTQCASTADNVICGMCRGTTWVFNLGAFIKATQGREQAKVASQQFVDELNKKIIIVLDESGKVEAERDRLREEVGILRNAQPHLRQQVAALQDKLQELRNA